MVTLCIPATGKYYELGLRQARVFAQSPDYQVLIFTNREEIPVEGVTVCKVDHGPWPHATLSKFRYVLEHADKIKGDYVIIHDADTTVKELPPASLFAHKLLAMEHPGYLDQATPLLPFERYAGSQAYVSPSLLVPYRGAALMGGERAAFLRACQECNDAIIIDRRRGFVATWHDEAHWNNYLTRHSHDVVLFKTYDKFFNVSDKGGMGHAEARAM